MIGKHAQREDTQLFLPLRQLHRREAGKNRSQEPDFTQGGPESASARHAQLGLSRLSTRPSKGAAPRGRNILTGALQAWKKGERQRKGARYPRRTWVIPNAGTRQNSWVRAVSHCAQPRETTPPLLLLVVAKIADSGAGASSFSSWVSLLQTKLARTSRVARAGGVSSMTVAAENRRSMTDGTDSEKPGWGGGGKAGRKAIAQAWPSSQWEGALSFRRSARKAYPVPFIRIIR